MLLFRLCLAAGLLLAQPSVARAAHNGQCHLIPNGASWTDETQRIWVGWSDTQKWAWQQICDNRVADLRTAGPEDKTIKAQFLETILTTLSWRGEIPRHGIRIMGATVTGNLDLSNADIPHNLALAYSKLASVNLRDAYIGGHLGFTGSQVVGPLILNRLTTASGLSMQKGGDVNERSKFADINLVSADIGEFVDLRGAEVTGELDMERLKTKSNLIMWDEGKFNDIILIDSNIGHNIAFGHRSKYKPSTISGVVQMLRASVGGSVYISNTTLNEVDMEGAKIAGTLILNQPDSAPPVWKGNSLKLILTNARAESVKDSEDSWPPEVQLRGFTFNNFASGDYDLSARDPNELISWLAKSKPYSPQPYEHLAQRLTEAGHRDKAKAVLYAKENRNFVENAEGGEKFFLWLEHVTVGYGYHPFWALGWLGLIIAVGSVFGWKSNNASLPNYWESLEYAADMVLPIVKFRHMHTEIDHPNRYVRLYFYFHQLMGYFLAYFIITAMTTS